MCTPRVYIVIALKKKYLERRSYLYIVGIVHILSVLHKSYRDLQTANFNRNTEFCLFLYIMLRA